MAHAPDIDLPEHSAAEDEKEEAESPPVIMPFRLSLCSKEVFVRVILINMALHAILLCLLHVRFTGVGLGKEHHKKSPHQKDSQ